MTNPIDPSTDTLTAALARHCIEVPEEAIERLDAYRQLLWSWNEKINLTRHTDLDKFVTRDVVDSMALERFLETGERVLDVGTGGGVPGVILAIVRPDLEVTLCESVAKKARVAADIVEQLGLPVSVAHARAEEMLELASYETLVARAVAPLTKLLTWLEPHWDSFEQLLAIKGRNWTAERLVAKEKGQLKQLGLRRLLSYETPGTDAESVVLRVFPKNAEEREWGN